MTASTRPNAARRLDDTRQRIGLVLAALVASVILTIGPWGFAYPVGILFLAYAIFLCRS